MPNAGVALLCVDDSGQSQVYIGKLMTIVEMYSC